MVRIGWRSLLVIVPFSLLPLPAFSQADAAKDKAKKDIRTLNESLRGVINTGAELFNKNGDYVGCYRLFHGSLLAVKPFLSEKMQKEVEQGIARSEKIGAYDERAFELRRVLDAVRLELKAQEDALNGNAPELVPSPKHLPKTVDPPKVDPPKVEPPKVKVDPPKVDPPKIEPPKVKVDPPKTKPEVTGNVQGKVLFEGAALPAGTSAVDYKDQPRPAGYLLLVTSEGRKVSTAIRLDGAFAFKSVLGPGLYRVAIEKAPEQTIPAKDDIPNHYRNADTSGLTVQILPGSQFLEIRLVK